VTEEALLFYSPGNFRIGFHRARIYYANKKIGFLVFLVQAPGKIMNKYF